MRTAFIAGLLALVVEAQQPVRIALPVGATGGSCTDASTKLTIARQDGLSISFACPLITPATIACTFEKFEPLDVSSAQVCQRRSLPIVPAIVRSVIASPEPLQVEWLQISARGDVRRLALRSLAGGLLSIPVSPAPDRWIRVLRDGFSPVTIEQRAIGSEWRLPPAVGGGELVLISDPAKIVPSAYRMSAPGVSRSLTREQLGSVAGLAPGTYSIVPDYGAGVVGAEVTASVVQGQSAIVHLPRERVGSVRIVLDRNACYLAREVGVSRADSFVRDGVTRTSVSPAAREQIPTADCSKTFSGLKPGKYIAFARGESGKLGTREFEIREQEITEASVGVSGANVSGTVRVNGAAFSGTISFEPSDPSTDALTAPVRNGLFSLDVPRPDDYKLSLTQGVSPLVGLDRILRVEPGQNSLEWSVEAGSLTVEVIGLTNEAQAMVRLVGVDVRPDRRLTARLNSSQTVFAGIAFGTYTVSAFGPSESSEVKTITIDRNHPTVGVTLDLRKSSVVLAVVDQNAVPIGNANVIVNLGTAVSIRPGEFRLEGVAAGSPVILRASGYAPTCRVAPRDGSLVATLAKGRSVILEIDRSELLRQVVNIVGLPNSDCSIPLSSLQPRRVPDGVDGSLRFAIESFPSQDVLGIQTNDGLQTARVDPAGVIRIK